AAPQDLTSIPTPRDPIDPPVRRPRQPCPPAPQGPQAIPLSELAYRAHCSLKGQPLIPDIQNFKDSWNQKASHWNAKVNTMGPSRLEKTEPTAARPGEPECILW